MGCQSAVNERHCSSRFEWLAAYIHLCNVSRPMVASAKINQLRIWFGSRRHGQSYAPITCVIIIHYHLLHFTLLVSWDFSMCYRFCRIPYSILFDQNLVPLWIIFLIINVFRNFPIKSIWLFSNVYHLKCFKVLKNV